MDAVKPSIEATQQNFDTHLRTIIREEIQRYMTKSLSQTLRDVETFGRPM